MANSHEEYKYHQLERQNLCQPTKFLPLIGLQNARNQGPKPQKKTKESNSESLRTSLFSLVQPPKEAAR